ncbi:MAG: hypothetical protein HDT21_12710 [Ruminococcus sp.]|nr:hypothetical protein [Ruminococcus sp.]
MSAPPRNAFAFLTPFTVLNDMRLRARGEGFRTLRSATKGRCPLDFCQLGSAGPALVGGVAA